MTVQKFRMATNQEEAASIPGEFPCAEYVIKAQVLAGGRGKGHFDNGFKGGVHLTKDPSKVNIQSIYLKKTYDHGFSIKIT